MADQHQPRYSNPIADGVDWLFGTNGYAELRRKREEERRAALTNWQRRREDAKALALGAGVFIGGPAIVFGPWLIGAWVIARWAFGGRP